MRERSWNLVVVNGMANIEELRRTLECKIGACVLKVACSRVVNVGKKEKTVPSKGRSTSLVLTDSIKVDMSLHDKLQCELRC